jgi:predicted DNA-binding protein with PD1-like motif
MAWRKIHEVGGQRTFAMVLKTKDEAMASLKEMATAERLDAAQITGIGAYQAAVIRYFDWNEKSYHDISVDEQVEVASLIGDIASDENGEPVVHIHIVLGRRDGSAMAGHLKSGIVRPTLELIVTEAPAHLARKHDPQSGLALISLRE